MAGITANRKSRSSLTGLSETNSRKDDLLSL
jgi:hypothetical protein